MLEVLVVPHRMGDVPLATRYAELLSKSRGIRLVEVDDAQQRAAAQLSARHNLRTPDALQLAAALTTLCSTFVTNDRHFPSEPEMRIVRITDHL